MKLLLRLLKKKPELTPERAKAIFVESREREQREFDRKFDKFVSEVYHKCLIEIAEKANEGTARIIIDISYYSGGFGNFHISRARDIAIERLKQNDWIVGPIANHSISITIN